MQPLDIQPVDLHPSASMVVRIFPTTPCACRKRWLSSLGPPPSARRGCSNNMSSPRGGVPRMQKFKAFLIGAQGYQRFPLLYACRSEYSFGCCACLQGFDTYLVSAFPAHSTSFFPKFLQIFNGWMCFILLSIESTILLVVGIHFISPRKDCS